MKGYKEVFKLQLGAMQLLFEWQPLFSKKNSYLEDGKPLISLTPVFAYIEKIAKERGFVVDLDKHSFDWHEDWIHIYEKKL